MAASAQPTHIDADELRRKYQAERDKRLRPDGLAQYVHAPGPMCVDPWSTPTPRPPVVDHVTFTFVGGGWSGVLAAVQVKKAGVDDVRIVDTAGDLGGVWYWNRYPGAMCDSPSLIYLPLLEETGHMPTEKYVHGPEIREHFQRIGRQFGLYDQALFHTRVEAITWDDAQHHWLVTTDRGDAFTTTFVGIGPGQLSVPKLPGIDGVDDFGGHQFHTSRWDYAFTGGDPVGAPLDKLADKRVAVIGTGASAIQCVPDLARDSGELYVFQRTPSSVDERNNALIDPDWFKGISTPGWQQGYHDNFIDNWEGIRGLPREDVDVENLFEGDGFTNIARRVRGAMRSVPIEQATADAMTAAVDLSDLAKMSEVRARTDQIVEDPDTAERLKPWFGQMCKRPTFHDEYLQSFNNPTTRLVDTDGKGVDRITESGVVVAGVEHAVDVIIWASGFDFAGFDLIRGITFDIVGVDGVSLYEAWKDGMRTLHGMHVHGFPNMFVVQLSQGSFFGSNVPTNWMETGRTIAAIISHADASGYSRVEATSEAETAWVEMLLEETAKAIGSTSPVGASAICPPGYYNYEGQSITPYEQRLIPYPFGPRAFFDLIHEWQTNGRFEGLGFGQDVPAAASTAGSPL